MLTGAARHKRRNLENNRPNNPAWKYAVLVNRKYNATRDPQNNTNCTLPNPHPTNPHPTNPHPTNRNTESIGEREKQFQSRETVSFE